MESHIAGSYLGWFYCDIAVAFVCLNIYIRTVFCEKQMSEDKNSQKVAEEWLDDIKRYTGELCSLNSQELFSLLKSNRIEWKERKSILALAKRTECFEVFTELIPVIAITGIVVSILTQMGVILQKNEQVNSS